MRVCTNNTDFYNYLQSKFHDVVYFETPLDGYLNVFFPKCHDITVCGNRFNEQRLESGNFQDQCAVITEYLTHQNTIVITPVTMYGGSMMKEHCQDSWKVFDKLVLTKQNIDTRDLGELIVPHRLQIWSNNGTELRPVDRKYMHEEYFEYNGKRQQMHYLNVINKSHNTLERRKLRYIPEYALYSQLYHQLIAL